MGYTIENGKVVIWTEKIFQAYKYPFNQDGENYTCFYKNLYDNKAFATCLASSPDKYKKQMVSDAIDIPVGKFILKSKKSHHNQKRKQQQQK